MKNITTALATLTLIGLSFSNFSHGEDKKNQSKHEEAKSKKDHSKHDEAKKKMNHSGHDDVEHKGHDHGQQEAKAKINKDKVLITVQGMVCAFCAQGIEKNFKAKDEVENVKVDLDKMEVLVEFKKGKSLSEEVIKEIITGAGFKFVGTKE